MEVRLATRIASLLSTCAPVLIETTLDPRCDVFEGCHISNICIFGSRTVCLVPEAQIQVLNRNTPFSPRAASTKGPQASLDDVPPDLLLGILLRLPLVDRLRCSLVSKKWAAFQRDPEFWAHIDFRGARLDLLSAELVFQARWSPSSAAAQAAHSPSHSFAVSAYVRALSGSLFRMHALHVSAQLAVQRTLLLVSHIA